MLKTRGAFFYRIYTMGHKNLYLQYNIIIQRLERFNVTQRAHVEQILQVNFFN